MTVYEATTRKHFRKIKQFIKNQPEGSLSKACWNVARRRKDFEELKAMFPTLSILICEDDNGKARVIVFWLDRTWDDRGTTLKSKQILVGLVNDDDLLFENPKFLEEITDWMIKNLKEHDIPIFILNTALMHYDILKAKLGENAITVVKEYDFPSPRVKGYFVRIDLRKCQ